MRLVPLTPARPRHARRAAALTLVATLGLVTAGCSSDDQPATGEPTSDAAASDAAASASATPDPSTPTAEPSVAPAVGATVQRDTYSFVLPDGFVDNGGPANGLLKTGEYVDEQRPAVIYLSELADITAGLTFEEAAGLGEDGKALTRQPDREVGGEQVFVYTGQDSSGATYKIGRIAGEEVVTMTFVTLSETAEPAVLDETLVESVLATVRWQV